MRTSIFARSSVALSLMALAGVSVSASAATNPGAEIRWADQRVVHQEQQTRIAVKSGDAATIAVEQAKLKAARAVAWSKRHPAKVPVAGVAMN